MSCVRGGSGQSGFTTRSVLPPSLGLLSAHSHPAGFLTAVTYAGALSEAGAARGAQEVT